MKSGTARGLKTLLYLGIVGAGAYWAYYNVLPAIARAVNSGGGSVPSGGGTTSTPSNAGNLNISDVARDMATDFSFGFSDILSSIQKGFSSLGVAGAALDAGNVQTMADYNDPARRAAALAVAQASFDYTPTVRIGRGSGAGRSWLDPEELERRLALSEQLTQGSSPSIYGGGGGLYLTM